nr:calmodulin-4-like [Ziziphus jujuba var. spinosa]
MNMNLNLQILFTIAEYIGRKLLLQSPSKQSRLLEKLPGVIADVVEIEHVFDNSFTKVKQGPNILPESPVGQASQTLSTNLGSESNSSPNGRTDVADYYRTMPQEQKHNAYNMFLAMDLNGDGRVTIDEYVEIFDELSFTISNPRFIRELDKNGDGILDFEEFVSLFYLLMLEN